MEQKNKKQTSVRFQSTEPQKTSQVLHELEGILQEWTSTSLGRREFLASLAVLLSACSSAPKTRYREGDNTGQGVKLTVEEERQLTAKVLPDMRKEYPPVQHPGLQRYVSDLGMKLVQSNQLEGRPYTYNFTAVDVAYVNAFALPAGTIFVTAPLIEMAESEAELVGVIGHEVGHVQARHTAERMYQAEKAQGKTLLYTLGGGLLGAAAGYGVGQMACPPKDQKCKQKALQLGALAGAGGGLLIQKFAFMANSREDEMEADRIGFRTSLRAGYDKDRIGAFYAKLLRMEEASKRSKTPILSSLADAMSTHPPSRERVQQMNEMAQTAQQPAGAIVSTPEFSQIKAVASQVAARARDRSKS